MNLILTPKKIFREVRAYIIISIGLLCYSFGFTAMLVNAGIVTGGAGGMGTLLYYAFGQQLDVGIYYFLVNVVLILIGIPIIGFKFGFKTIYAIIFNSIALSLMQHYLPADLLGMDPNTDKLLMAIMGGALAGFGVGTCFTQGGSSGGTDIIALIVSKYRNISLGKIIMVCDIIVIACSYFVFGQLKPIIYGFVTMAVIGYTVDLVMSGSRQSVQIMVFSPQYMVIGDRIIAEANRGVSYLHSEGGFTHQPQKVVMVVCRKSEQSLIYHIIKETDPDAFISAGSVSGVYGKGFEALKLKKEKEQKK